MTSFEVLISCEPDLMPTMGNPGDAGYDLRSAENAVVPARSRRTVNTGVSIALPAGYVALVHPRSGLAAKNGITVLNAPGTVDAGYRGQMLITLVNHSDEDFEITRDFGQSFRTIYGMSMSDFEKRADKYARYIALVQ